jgi:hypothetical protein
MNIAILAQIDVERLEINFNGFGGMQFTGVLNPLGHYNKDNKIKMGIPLEALQSGELGEAWDNFRNTLKKHMGIHLEHTTKKRGY